MPKTWVYTWKIIKIEICREFEEFSQPFLHHCQADSYHQIGSHWGRNLPTTQVAGKSWSNHRGVVDTLLEPRPHDHHHRGQEVKSVLLSCEEWSKQNQLILQQSALCKLLRTQSLCHPRHRSKKNDFTMVKVLKWPINCKSAHLEVMDILVDQIDHVHKCI